MTGTVAKSVRLRCVACGTEGEVEDRLVAGKPVKRWFVEDRGSRCQNCYDRPTGQVYVRSDARDTSREAAERAKRRSGGDAAKLLEIFHDAGAKGLTTDEATALLAQRGRTISPNQAAARVLGLRQDRLLLDTGMKRKTRTGSAATVWAHHQTVP